MSKQSRKPYKRPQVSKVRLIPEEAVLSGCKTGGTTGKPQAPGRCAGACVSAIGS